MFGGCIDEDYLWNSTIMSNQELYYYQQAYGGGGAQGSSLGVFNPHYNFDNQSFYSHQLISTSNNFPQMISELAYQNQQNLN